MSVSGTLQINLTITEVKAGVDLSDPVDTFKVPNQIVSVADGAGANKAQIMHHNQYTGSDGGTVQLELYDGVENSFGQTLRFSKLKAVYIKNLSTDSGVQLTRNANGVVIVSDVAGAFVPIPKNGGRFYLEDMAEGFVVTDATADLIDLVDDGLGAVGDKEIEVFLLGEGAVV